MNGQALEWREKVLGKEHPSTLTSVGNLASMLRYQGKYGEAEAMNRRALEGYEKVLGKEHPDTLMSVGNLAYLLHRQQNFRERCKHCDSHFANDDGRPWLRAH